MLSDSCGSNSKSNRRTLRVDGCQTDGRRGLFQFTNQRDGCPLDERVSGFFPALYSPCKGLGSRIAHAIIFGCLTGRSGFFGSGAVEYNLLVLG